jgi:hypothetical protein
MAGVMTPSPYSSAADQPDDEEGGAPAVARRMPDIEKRQERHDATLPVIVGPHEQDGVFERHDHDHGPEDQRRDTEDCVGRQCSTRLGGLLEGVERARSDIAIDDAERRESSGGGQRPGVTPQQRSLWYGTLHPSLLRRGCASLQQNAR